MNGTYRLSDTFWIALATLPVFVVIAALGSRTFVADSIMSLYLGREIFANGIPHVDSLTIEGRDRPWVDQQWLAQVLYFGSWKLAGYTGAALVSAIAYTSGFAIMTRVLLRRGVPGLQAVGWIGLALAVMLGNSFVRAQSLAIVLFALIIALLARDERTEGFRPGTWIAILATLAVWSNVHGSVLLTIPAVCGWALLRAVRERDRPRRERLAWIASAIAAPATLLATPYGVGILRYYRDVLGNDAIANHISEWQPGTFTDPASLPFFALLLGTVAAVAFTVGRSRPVPLLPALLTLWFLAIGTQALRYHVWAAFPAILLLSDMVRLRTMTDAESVARARRLLTPILIGTVVCGVAVIFSFATRSERAWLSSIPLRQVDAAAAWLDQHPGTRVIADDPSAPALLWLHEDIVRGRIAFDARLEHFDRDDLAEYFRFITGIDRTWLDAVAGYDVIVISELYHPHTVRQLDNEPSWRIESRSSDGRMYVRSRTS